MKTLTITIENIPDSYLNQAWRAADDTAEAMWGIKNGEVENMKIDFSQILKEDKRLAEKKFADIFFAAATLKMHQKLNQAGNHNDSIIKPKF